MADYELEKYTGGGDKKVLNRTIKNPPKGEDGEPLDGDHFYSYAHPELVSFLNGLDGKWDIGNMSQPTGGKLSGGYSKGHQDGKDVDLGIPYVGGKSSMIKEKIVIDKATIHGPHAFENATKKLDKIDTKKLKEFFEYAVPLVDVILVDQKIIDHVGYKGGRVIHWDNHKDHIHVRLKGGKGSKEGPKLPKERTKDSDEKEREKKRGKKLPFPSKSDWEDAKNWSRARNEVQKDRRPFYEFPKKLPFNTGVSKDAVDQIIFQIIYNSDIREKYNSWIDNTSKFSKVGYFKERELNSKQRDAIYKKITKYSKSPRTKDSFDNLIKFEASSYAPYVVIMNFAKHYNETKRQFNDYLDENPFIYVPNLQENRGSNKMRITKEKLAQIIKEEVEAYKASQLSEIDVDELEEAEAYIKEVADLLKSTYETIFKGAAPAIGTPQTKADTGEPVTDQTAHEDAKGLLLDLLGDAIDEFQQKEPELNEDGHDDVPSAVRAMKTMAEDALEMLDALEQMDGSLPTWWTNKMAVSASMLNKMRDYLLVPSMEEEMDEQ